MSTAIVAPAAPQVNQQLSSTTQTSIAFNFAGLTQTVTITHRGHSHTYPLARWMRSDWSTRLYWDRDNWITRKSRDGQRVVWVRKTAAQIAHEAQIKAQARASRAATLSFTRQQSSQGWLRTRRAQAGY